MLVRYDWNEAKRRANVAKHGVDFSDAPAFEWADAVVELDIRQNYGEMRWIAFGPIGRRLHVMVYVERDGGIRLISLRKANQREFDYYVSQIDTTE
ncbi:MAG: BrnT family toxin [Pollutimonas bauzanensis]|uniref:Uncharacterized protein n=1 Tax=Pollutimonas bauzanensis TaxID=658167 RepID=A0A1M5LQ06_9BURK|nr:BrnT family toxin [Pollutimonas bauzanensis]SHG67184.1 hypothetical protein SAMN04488135_10113 [Pollutimonas bauzanensis]